MSDDTDDAEAEQRHMLAQHPESLVVTDDGVLRVCCWEPAPSRVPLIPLPPESVTEGTVPAGFEPITCLYADAQPADGWAWQFTEWRRQVACVVVGKHYPADSAPQLYVRMIQAWDGETLRTRPPEILWSRYGSSVSSESEVSKLLEAVTTACQVWAEASRARRVSVRLHPQGKPRKRHAKSLAEWQEGGQDYV